jgi:pimeloyl-ACP methyl ester carboxylesterase
MVGRQRLFSPGSRPGTALLVHGWGSNGASWAPIASRLSFGRVLTPDLLGHGLRTSELDEVVTVPRTADDLARSLSGQPADVAIGHSMGGQVVVRLALRAPSLARALVVVDPAYCADADEMRSAPERLDDLQHRGAVSGAEFAEGAFVAGEPADLRHAVVEQMLNTPGSVLTSLFSSMYLEPESLGATAPALSALRLVRVPVLGVYSSARAADRVADVPWAEGSDVVVWPAAGHYLHLERPAAFADLVNEWLRGL